MKDYKFSAEEAYAKIRDHWINWAQSVGMWNPETGSRKWVVGVSGGVDSTVVLTLASRIFGSDSVYGVMLPQGVQKDMVDSEEIIKLTQVNRVLIPIGASVSGLMTVMELEGYPELSEQAKINLPPRIRLAALYMVAQSVGGMVLNTSNISEDILGYATLWGDTCGSYAPIQGLTKTEVMELADWLGIPEKLGHKTPADGLQDKSDEERLGVTYAAVDRLIRTGEGSIDLIDKVMKMYRSNKFKLDMIKLPGPKFEELPNKITK